MIGGHKLLSDRRSRYGGDLEEEDLEEEDLEDQQVVLTHRMFDKQLLRLNLSSAPLNL